jgi:hypothetical protein
MLDPDRWFTFTGAMLRSVAIRGYRWRSGKTVHQAGREAVREARVAHRSAIPMAFVDFDGIPCERPLGTRVQEPATLRKIWCPDTVEGNGRVETAALSKRSTIQYFLGCDADIGARSFDSSSP